LSLTSLRLTLPVFSRWRAWMLLLCVLLPTSLSLGQWIEDPAIDSLVQRGIFDIYDIKFEKADTEFAEVVRLKPDHPAGYFFQAMTEWWRILTNFDDESHDDQYYEMLQKVIDLCDKRLEKNGNDVTALFFKGGAVGFRGRLRANRGSWLKAANDGLIALPAVRKAYELEPNNYDVLLGMGIYNYYAEVVPDLYPIVKPLMIFLPSGDKKKGLEQLELAAQKARYAKTEAAYFLLQTYFTYEKQYIRALELARDLFDKYPRNPLFHRMYGRCYVSIGYWGEAFKVFSEIEKRFNAHQEGYDAYDGREAYYYIGRDYFLSGKLDEALESLYKCDELSRRIDKDGASGFMSMANLTVGMIYDLQKKRSAAVEQYRKVLDMKEYENTRKDARRYLEKPYSRN
jgi:tetratricopeptide (TPR) repeat protein